MPSQQSPHGLWVIGYYQMFMRNNMQGHDLWHPLAIQCHTGPFCAEDNSVQSHWKQHSKWWLCLSLPVPMTPSSPPQLLPLFLYCGAILCSTASFCLEPQYPHQLGWHLLSSSTWAEDLKNCVPPSQHCPVCRLESKPQLIRYLETRCYDMY